MSFFPAVSLSNIPTSLREDGQRAAQHILGSRTGAEVGAWFWQLHPTMPRFLVVFKEDLARDNWCEDSERIQEMKRRGVIVSPVWYSKELDKARKKKEDLLEMLGIKKRKEEVADNSNKDIIGEVSSRAFEVTSAGLDDPESLKDIGKNKDVHNIEEIRTPLPHNLVQSIKEVLAILKGRGECPINCRDFPSRFRSLTRAALDPAQHGHSSAQAMLEYMAEYGECSIVLVQGRVCVTSNGKAISECETMVDRLGMLDMSWTVTGELPPGAVGEQGLEEQSVMNVEESSNIPVQITEVVNLDKVWFCLKCMEEEMDKMMVELDKFYTKWEGKDWVIPHADYCWPGRIMAAPFQSEGYHRVMVKKMMKKDLVSVFFVDYGTIGKVRLENMRLLHRKFLMLPAQAIPGRMWGVRDVHGKEAEAKCRLVELVSDEDMTLGLVGRVMAGRSVGKSDRRKDGAVDDEGRLALWLVDLDLEGEVINEMLIQEGLAQWDEKDISRWIKNEHGYGDGEGFNEKNNLPAMDLILGVFEQILQINNGGGGSDDSGCQIDDEILENVEEVETETQENSNGTGKKINIITVDDSEEEDVEMLPI